MKNSWKVAAAGVAVIAASVTAVAISSRSSPRRASTATPTYSLKKANYGIAPGAGFLLNIPTLQRGLDDFKTIGLHWIRSTIPWKNFNPTAGTYNWRGTDELVATLHSAKYAGLFDLIVTVESPPAWATKPAVIGHMNCAEQPPFDLDAYATATAALAVHLKGTASVFEIENSPNISPNVTEGTGGGFWAHPNPCGYAALLRRVNKSVHAAVPGSTVLVGGIGGVKTDTYRMAADEFLAAVYANNGRAFDGVAYHPYSTPQLPCAPTDEICVYNPEPSHKDPYGLKNSWDRMLHSRNIMVDNGDSAKKVWITEYGGPTVGVAGDSRILTEQQQSDLLIAGFGRASQYPWVAMMCWFTWHDEGTDPVHDPTGDWMGLTRVDYTHKPAFSTFQALMASAT